MKETVEPCLAVVQDTERMTTYCARPSGHDGKCAEVESA